MDFNSKPSNVMHIDLNSCFATVEQQANPFLRGKPIAVAAYDSPRGCILAPSVEAKKLGIKVGMRVFEGRAIYPKLIVKTPDPDKYRDIHKRLHGLLADYTDEITPKSIDEFVLDLTGRDLWEIAREIKTRIKKEIGDYLTVSVGIAPNRFLAKTAAGLHKPDGLDEINVSNFLEIYSKLKLTDLCGIKAGNAGRLNSWGIFTVMDFFNASATTLQRAFRSVVGRDWYLRLHGYEADLPVGRQVIRSSFGNSFALPKPLSTPEELAPILAKLVEKTGFRMRQAGFLARGVHVGVLFKDHSYWHHGMVVSPVFDSRDIFKIAFKILSSCPKRDPVHILSESCFNLEEISNRQLEMFSGRKEELVLAMDKINARWGSFTIAPGLMLGTENFVLDRIAFGGIKV